MTDRSSDIALDRGLPSSVDAERSILGAILLDNKALDEARAHLKPSDFSLESHQRITRSMGAIRSRGEAIDVITLGEELAKRKETDAVGGMGYVSSLIEGLPRRLSITEYVKIVKDKSILRQLMNACSDAIARCADQSEFARQIATDLQSAVDALNRQTDTEKSAQVSDFIIETLEKMNREYMARVSPAIPSGNAWFDHKTGGGYRIGKLTLICARPGTGKTGWATMSAAYNCLQGRKVVFFSLEKERDELMADLMPYVVDLPNVVAARPWTQTPEQNKLANEAGIKLFEWPLVVYDGEMDIDEICWTVERETPNDEETLFVFDHARLIGSKKPNPREKMNDVSERLMKKLKPKRAAGILLCQLRKADREHADKAPIQDDIKETGNLLEDAYAVLMLHRERDKESMRLTTRAQLNLTKLRGGGSTGTTDATFDTKQLRFDAPAEVYEQSDFYQ